MEKIEIFIALLLGVALSVHFVIQGQDYGSQDYGSQDYGSSNATSENSTGNGTQADDYYYYYYYYEEPQYPSECPMNQFSSQQEFDDCCAAMDANRRNFSDCCEYPQLVVWQWQYNMCIKNVQAKGQEPNRCNVMPCCYQYMGTIDSTVTKSGIKVAGLKYSFLLSVNNNTAWVKPINESVEICNKHLRKTVPSKRNANAYKSFWDCYETIPLYLYDIIGCSYNFN
ncbi:unnamed protein product [Chironomus riparius]|uniref:Uncharacterized protein n=1 Tax=Chironomus riparius TaxID=315576 RepID=A0A9N9WWI3_9DIPT|nr:unnamed protein product [Chironomus riparius]